MIKILKTKPNFINAFIILFELFCILFLSLFLYLARPISSSEVIFIPKGGVSEIITYLINQNFNVSKIDMLALYYIGKPQAGWIDINKTRLSRLEFLKRITTAKAALTEITLIPGETTIIFLNQTADKLNLDKNILNAEYNATAPLNDGFLIPDTYKIPIGISEKDLIKHLINSSKKAHKELNKENFDDKKWFEILTIASIIQKEAANGDEMPLVASVIYNRLKKGMRLQMDGTLNYGIYSHEVITPERIRTDMSEFNTYLNDGLPPEPICAVSPLAIKAALNPAQSEFLFFVRDKKTKKHRFSKSIDEHNQNINEQR